MEQALYLEKPTQKIYTNRAILVGTFFGGPLVAGYQIAVNFKAFKQTDKAIKTLIYSIIATVVIFGGILLIPDNVKIPSQLFPLIYTPIVNSLVKHFQGNDIKAHINSGGQLFGWWRTIGISVIGLAIIFFPLFGYAYLANPKAIASSTKTYGTLKHEILFDKTNISENEINQIAVSLTVLQFFDEAQRKTVFVRKENKKYIIIIPLVDNAWNDANAISFFNQFRNDLQTLYSNNKIIIGLGSDFENIKKWIE